MDEKQLIQACAKADAKAQKILYERYSGHVMGICLRYTANREDAEEIFHDSFLRVFQNIQKFSAKSSIKTWVHRIAVNTAIDFLRKRKNALVVEHISTEMLNTTAEDDLEEEISLEAGTAMRVLKMLPWSQQIAINLYIIDEFSHKEIAAQLGISEQASRAAVSRARKTLIQLTKSELHKNAKKQSSK